MKVLIVQHPTEDNLFLSLDDNWAPLRFAKMFTTVDRSMRFIPKGGRWFEIEDNEVIRARDNIVNVKGKNAI